jgi:predicted DNA-binding protein
MKFKNQTQERKSYIMGRKKVDRSNKIMQTFESTKPLKERLVAKALKRGLTVSALIREILEKYFEERN